MRKKVIEFLLWAVSIMMALLAIATLWVALTTSPGRPPKIGGISLLRIASGSMRPELTVNSLIFVKSVPIEEIERGDIISFFSRDPMLGGALVTHRVIEISAADGWISLVTQGDANNVADAYPVDRSNLMGRVVFRSRLLGLLVAAVSSRWGVLLIIMIPLVILLLLNLRDFVALLRKRSGDE